MDQGLFAPTFISIFLSSMAVLEGGSVKEKLDKNYIPALTANYMIWPFVQLVNFKFVPLQHRSLVRQRHQHRLELLPQLPEQQREIRAADDRAWLLSPATIRTGLRL